MNHETIEMGEWYRHDGGGGEEFTPLSLHIDPYAVMAFRKRSDDKACLLSVFDMEHVPQPAPKPVVFIEQWIVLNRRGVNNAYNSLETAKVKARFLADSLYHSPAIGILHVRTDGTTKMLEVES